MTVEEAVKTKVKDNKEREGRTRQQKSKKKQENRYLATQISEQGVTKDTKV